MNTKLLFSSIVLSILAPLLSFGEVPKIIFEENKNQWPDHVMYQADIRGGHLFLEKSTFTYLFMENVDFHDHNSSADEPIMIKYHSFKVNFKNSNPDVEVLGNNLLSWQKNYYRGNDPGRWAENVKLYGQVYYKGLYSSIDMNVYNVDQNLKYDLIIHPGGNVKDIKFNYNGPDKIYLEYGHLYIKTSVGTIIEQKPYAYQEINGIKTEVSCSYVVKNNTLSFSINSNYDKSLPLIIDPTLIACTYTGSAADNWGYTATYDAAGNIYTGGIARTGVYPTTLGAFQTSFQGGGTGGNTISSDIVLTKFNPTGAAILFSTYYGGSDNEQPHSIMVNSSNELYVVGRTYSTNFPATNGSGGTSIAYDQTQNGGCDIIVGKFNNTGALMASTYIGGTGDDCVNVSATWTSYSATKYNYADDGRSEIILDNNSNVYVAACTRSANFPTVNAYDATLGGVQDGVVFKMNSTLSALTFSTYLGGSNIDAAYGLKLDNSNNVYVTGGTTSVDFPTTPGVIHTTFQGGTVDGFIAVLDNSGSSLLRATYLGTNQYDQSYLIEIDASGDIYVFGQTKGAYLVTAGVYSNLNGRQFIHKLSGLLNSTIFSTVIGTNTANPNISPTAFLVDSCQSIYISGWGRCATGSQPDQTTVTGMPVTANAYQPTTVNGCNFYFAVLTPNAKTLWYATFFGQQNATARDHVDGGTSRFDKRAFIYQSVCASCGGQQGWPTTPGAVSATNNSTNCNNAVVKMDVQVKPVAVAVALSPTSGCAPHTMNFINTGSAAAYYVWDFGDGSPIVTIPNPSHTYSFVGTYTLTLFAVDSIGICGFIATDTLIIYVGAPPVLTTSQTNILCNGGVGSATVTPTGGMNPLTYSWNTSPAQTTITATGLAQGTYTITVSDALGCSSMQTVTITQPPPLTLTTSPVGASCGIANGSATANAGGGIPGYTYAWTTSPVQTTLTATGLAAANYTVLITDMNGCTKTATANITTASGPTIVTSILNNPCNGGNIGSASANPGGGTAPYSYQWSTSPVQTTATATGLIAGNYTVIVTDVNNCTATATVTVSQPPTALSTSVSPVNLLCFGDNNGSATVTANGGTPGYTYAWSTSPAQTTPTATGLIAGSYNVLVTDANGCTSTQPATITQPPALALTTTSSGSGCATISNGIASATVTNGTSPYTYLWSNSQTTSVISNLAGGTYTIVITDANGCTAQNSVTIPTGVQPLANFSNDSTMSCDGIAYMFNDLSSQGISSVWDFGDGTTSTLPNPIHVFPYSGTYVVSLIVTNPPCKDTAKKTVVIGDMSAFATVGAANIFTPNNDGMNDCFRPALIGPGADTLAHCIYLEVYDRWGIKMFESDDTKHCWDGNIQKNQNPCVDGTYYYIAKLGQTTINGFVTLVRKH